MRGIEAGVIHFLKTSRISPDILITFATLVFLLVYGCIQLFPSLPFLPCCGPFQKPQGVLFTWVYPQHRTKSLAQSTHLENYVWVCELWCYGNICGIGVCVLCVLGGRGRIGHNLILITIYLNSPSLSCLFLRNSALSKILMLLSKVNNYVIQNEV